MKILMHSITEGKNCLFRWPLPAVTGKIDQSGTWEKKISYKDTEELLHTHTIYTYFMKKLILYCRYFSINLMIKVNEN
jgi:hypothetical protein